MKIAIPSVGGKKLIPLSEASEFAVYNVENERVVAKASIKTNDLDLPQFLRKEKVNILICGRIPVEVRVKLRKCKVEFFSGASESSDETVIRFLSGESLIA